MKMKVKMLAEMKMQIFNGFESIVGYGAFARFSSARIR